MLNRILLGDCYELMQGIPDGSIDLVLTDPPYNTTECDFDKEPIDLNGLWVELKRVAKPNAAFVFTTSQPFTTDLINSNRDWFRYDIVWDKVNRYTGALNANKMPLRRHETILVFYKRLPTYNKQFRKGKAFTMLHTQGHGLHTQYGNPGEIRRGKNDGEHHNPCSIIEIKADNKLEVGLHPTQKPIELFEYLIKTYSNPGETIFDPFSGSGTTAVSVLNTGRNFICFEKEMKYWEIANKRLALAQMQGRFEEMVG
jgi:site-specific DNA-methyltransferase (adenine-specific)